MSGIMMASMSNKISSTFISAGALLYVDAGNTASYPGSGSTWTDLSVKTNNATLTNSPAFTSAGSASYFSFNGSNQSAPITSSKMGGVTYTGKTTMFSIRTVSANTNDATYRSLFGSSAIVRNFNTYLYHVSVDQWRLSFSTGPNQATWASSRSIPFTVTDNQWMVVAVTQTLAGVVTYYVNGIQIGTPFTGETFIQYAEPPDTAIAAADTYWNGDMGVCAVYGRALSNGEIAQNFNVLRSRYSI